MESVKMITCSTELTEIDNEYRRGST